jgi:hypothetical protein
MIPQIHTIEANTNIPSKEFITKGFPWYRENSYIVTPQTKTPDSNEPGDKLSSWAEIGDFHLDAQDPIPIVLDPYTIEMLHIESVDSSTNILENFVAQKLFAIPEVEYVFLSLENDSIDIWTVINKLESEVRNKIYDVEYDILDILKIFQFDFHVICRNDRNVTELYPSNARIKFQK